MEKSEVNEQTTSLSLIDDKIGNKDDEIVILFIVKNPQNVQLNLHTEKKSSASRQKDLTVYTNDWYLDPFALRLMKYTYRQYLKNK